MIPIQKSVAPITKWPVSEGLVPENRLEGFYSDSPLVIPGTACIIFRSDRLPNVEVAQLPVCGSHFEVADTLPTKQ